MQTRLYKNKKICIFLNHDYDYFTKKYYLCIGFQKRHKITKNYLYKQIKF